VVLGGAAPAMLGPSGVRPWRLLWRRRSQAGSGLQRGGLRAARGDGSFSRLRRLLEKVIFWVRDPSLCGTQSMVCLSFLGPTRWRQSWMSLEGHPLSDEPVRSILGSIAEKSSI